MKKITFTYIFFMAFLTAFGQLNPISGIYYQNRYLANPALTGEALDWEANVNYKAQWTAIEGAPSMQALTLTYGLPNKKVGLGVAINNETAGVFKRTNAKVSYAYHMITNADETSFLDLGLSGAVMHERIDFSKVTGDISDISLANFNERETYIDGDFGIAFRSPTLTLQAALPNLKQFFKKDVKSKIVDRATFMTSASYKFMSGDDETRIEPMVLYRGVQNYDDIFDAGIAVGLMNEKFNAQVMYHSTNSVTVGIGTVYQNSLGIFGNYTTNTSDLKAYSNGEFEIGLRYNFR